MTFKEKRLQKKEKLSTMKESLKQRQNLLETKSLETGAVDLQRQVDIYKLALSFDPMVKYAQGVIEIREELGDSPEITAIEESILDINKVKRSKRSELIRRTIFSTLALANITFLGKYAEFKNFSAIWVYSFITFWAPIYALGNSLVDCLRHDRDERRANDKYNENMRTLIKIMDHYGVSPDGFTLTKRFKEQK